MPYKRGMKYIGQIRRKGKRREKVFLTRKEALAWEVEMRKLEGQEWSKEISTACLGDAAQKYLNYAYEEFELKTYNEKRSVFRRLFKVVDPDLLVTELSKTTAFNYFQKQRKVRSGNAANKDRKNLCAFWTWGMDEGLNPPLPSPNPFKTKKLKEIRFVRYVPPENDFWLAYNVCDGQQDKVLLLVFFFLAVRKKEAFMLKVEDIDFDANRIRFWTRKRENGDLEADWLPLPKMLKEALEWWLGTRQVNSDYVFVCLDKHAFSRDIFGQPFVCRQHFMNKLCEKAGVKRFGFHAIRHLRATILYHQGKSLAVIQKILRHKSPNTTVRYLKSLGLDAAWNELDIDENPSPGILDFTRQELAAEKKKPLKSRQVTIWQKKEERESVVTY